MTGSLRIVCVEFNHYCRHGGHHIVSVGVGTNPNSASSQFSVEQVWNLIDSGYKFYTEASGYRAAVNKYHCACGIKSLRSSADATKANNLDNMRVCAWKAA